MKREYDMVIIGAGASGLMLASLLRGKKDILLIDVNSRVGAKIAVSGGGKCNVTNRDVSSDHYLGLEWFVQSVLDRFDQHEVIRWFTTRGVELELRKESQYFCKRSAEEIIAVFRRELDAAEMVLGTEVLEVSKEEERFLVQTMRGNFLAKHLVVASGGLSFAKLGASDIGFKIAEKFGHTVKSPSPALVGLTVQKEQFFFRELSGISVPAQIDTGEKIFEGNLLFTHTGVSGPVILNSSLYWRKGKISVNFLPHFSFSTMRGSKKLLSTLLPLPKKAAKCFLRELGVEDKPAVGLSPQEWRDLSVLQAYDFTPSGTFGYSRAEVTRGGVCVEEVDPYSMMSLKENQLYFIGEVLDVTGELGGYNFQWAFSSAFACADANG